MRLFLLFSLLVLPTASAAERGPAQARAIDRVRDAFVALMVGDLEAGVRWYTEMLDLREVMRLPPANGSEVVVLEGEGLIVELIGRDRNSAVARPSGPMQGEAHGQGFFKMGVVVDDLDRLVRILRGRGADIFLGPYPERTDQRANVIIRDNSGNLLQFFGAHRSDRRR